MADAVSYPPVHEKETIPFPGCIYIDWNEDAGFTPNPLIWGQWGENVADNQCAIMVPLPVPSAFRGANADNGLSDFLVCTLLRNGDVFDGYLYILEQPESTFNSVDYRYIEEDLMDKDNQILGGSVRVYHRLSPSQEQGYRFEEAFRQDVWGIGFGGPQKANLNGNSADGKESWVLPAGANFHLRAFGVSGVATLQKNGDDWVLLGDTCHQ